MRFDGASDWRLKFGWLGGPKAYSAETGGSSKPLRGQSIVGCRPIVCFLLYIAFIGRVEFGEANSTSADQTLRRQRSPCGRTTNPPRLTAFSQDSIHQTADVTARNGIGKSGVDRPLCIADQGLMRDDGTYTPTGSFGSLPRFLRGYIAL